jgi:hypothetical protein
LSYGIPEGLSSFEKNSTANAFSSGRDGRITMPDRTIVNVTIALGRRCFSIGVKDLRLLIYNLD